jgi:hypothetical protein
MLTNAVRLAPLLNRYFISAGGRYSVSIPHASQLLKIQEITVRGILLQNQSMTWKPLLLKRRVVMGKQSGRYSLQQDGSIAFCIGIKSLQPHIVCRLHRAAPWLFRLNQLIGERVAVGGFLRCSFDDAGFNVGDNAHIFEIHPVRNLEIGGQLHGFELEVAAPGVQDWSAELSKLDERREVRYWKGSDSLVFSNIDAETSNYVRVAGYASDITLNVSTNRPAWFILSSTNIARQVKVKCLQGTRAAFQLRDLGSTRLRVIGLRSIDLARALEGRYRINLLAIHIEPA